MKTAYIQSVGGASGDMLLGAILDAGLPIDAIHDAIAALQIPNVRLAVADETRCEVRGSRALVDTAAAPRYTPAEMLEAVANATALSDHTRARATAVLNALFTAEARVHSASSSPSNITAKADASKREIIDLVGRLGTASVLAIRRELGMRAPSKNTLSKYVSELVSAGVLRDLGSDPNDRRRRLFELHPAGPRSLSNGHLNPDDIHLHELGTADTLVDVVGVVHGLEQLGVERVCASPLVLGEPGGPRRPNGYSNPAPATLEIIAAANAPVAPERPFHANVGELTTPTGAALITTLADEYRQPAMTLHRIGVGIGGKNPPTFPNVIRLWLGEAAVSRHSGESRNPQADPANAAAPPFAHWQDNVILLETNIDNATGEQLGYAMEQLFNAGALDVWHTPIQMKKNRPAILLSALAPAELETQLAEAILRHTPTLGVRVRPITRYAAHRDTITAETDYGPIRLKRKYLSGQIVSQSPEHDDIAHAAQTHNLPWQTIANAVNQDK